MNMRRAVSDKFGPEPEALEPVIGGLVGTRVWPLAEAARPQKGGGCVDFRHWPRHARREAAERACDALDELNDGQAAAPTGQGQGEGFRCAHSDDGRT